MINQDGYYKSISTVFMKSILLVIVAIIISASAFSGCSNWKEKTKQACTGILLEVSPSGKVLWSSSEFKDPRCLNKDREGNRLIADKYTKMFFEYSIDGDLNWVYHSFYPEYIDKNSDGIYLLVNNHYPGAVYGVDNAGNKLFEYIHPVNIRQALWINPEEAIIFTNNDDKLFILNANGKISYIETGENIQKASNLQIFNKSTFLFNNTHSREIVSIDQANETTIIEDFRDIINVDNFLLLPDGNYVIADNANKNICFLSPSRQILYTLRSIETKSLTLMPDGNIGIAGRHCNPK
jgi:bifunctional DNA-binding transcriptional regulator/antitoxin component of YhaV-PrlF toxin-antitoxin module